MRKLFYKQIQELAEDVHEGYLAIIVDPGTLSEDFLGSKIFIHNGKTLYENDAHKSYWESHFNISQFESGSPVFHTGSFNEKIFIEYLRPKPTLVICGGGHVGSQVYNLSTMLGFDTIVIDNRLEFANSERFPKAVETICLPFTEALQKITYTSNTFFVLATSGHLHDRTCLEEVLKHPSAYVGMIGSKRKTYMLKTYLEEQGVSKELLDSVHAPIGLDIKAETPEEIAVSIMAEIISVKRSNSSESIINDPALLALASTNNPAALAIIIKKSGSIPRGAGSKMTVMEDGKAYGTIGGGRLENDAILSAVESLKTTTPLLLHFSLDNKSAEKEGMVCGGNALVYIEPIVR